MIHSFSIADLIGNFAPVSIEAVKLSDEQIERALRLARAGIDESQQWNLYLQAIAVFGFQAWSSERAGHLSLRYQDCSTFKPAYGNLLNSACNLQLGEYRLCLLVVGSSIDTTIAVPRAAIEIAEFMPDFYVLVEVEEEQDQISIRGCSLPERLAIPDSPESDWTYAVPIDCFTSTPDDLLLWIDCLEAKMLARSPRQDAWAIAPSYLDVGELQAKLLEMLPQIHKSESPLWQILTWEEAATILTQPQLAEWFERQRRTPLLSSSQPEIVPLEAPRSTVVCRAIEASLWLRDELDDLAQELGWKLLPPLATAMRATEEEVEAMVTELTRKGISIPLRARGVYRDISLLGVSLRLYAIIWPLLSPSSDRLREWTLLLVLGPHINRSLNSQVRLTIRDDRQMLVEQSLEPNSENTYLYARVAGSLEEQFWASIELNHYGLGSIVNLPPFCFVPG
jgi:hypothetical protein